jgi:hypothetical protein
MIYPAVWRHPFFVVLFHLLNWYNKKSERVKVVEAFSIFVLGYPAEERKQQDSFDESRIHFVK